MNPRKLLAQLGPRSLSLTRFMHRAYHRAPVCPQDVAGALAWIRNPVAAELYMLLWVPGYDTRGGRGAKLADALGGMLWSEWQRRAAPGYRSGPRLAPFPALPAKWAADPRAGCVAVARAVLFELQHRQDCPDCLGYGITPRLAGDRLQLLRCEPCLGQGYVPYAKHLRAQLVRIRRAVYLHHVDPAYRWLFGVAWDLEQRAASAHYRALREPALSRS